MMPTDNAIAPPERSDPQRAPAGSRSPASPTYTDIAIRSADLPGIRYASGHVIYDEALLDGQWIGRYWSPAGQVWPEMHLPEAKLRSAPASFRLGIEGEELAGGWRWLGAVEERDRSGLRCDRHAARQATVRLAHTVRPLEVQVCTRLDGSDWLVRWLEVTNCGEQATAISAVYPLAGRFWAHRCDEHLPAGVPAPFEVAYNHGTRWNHEGDLWFEPLGPGQLAFDGGSNGKSGWSRPAFWARDVANGQAFLCELAWSGNWRFELESAPVAGAQETWCTFAIGLPPVPGEMLRVLAPGETVRTPAVHIGHFQCADDRIVQSLHGHIRQAVMPAPPPGREVEIEANHRGYLCDRENEPDLLRDVEVAAEIGAELYVIDAGWYGNEPNIWWQNVGDWHAGPWLPNGLEPVVAHARAHGLRFGLWAEVEAAGANSSLRRDHPGWLLRRNGHVIGEGKARGRALDLTQPAVAGWIETEIERLIRRYRLDMFRIDHNHSLGAGGNSVRDGFTENSHWRYYEALYAIFDHLRVRFPDVVFQNCAGGGGRLDLGMLQRFHNTEASDWARLPRGLLILNGLSMALPPGIMLRIFGTELGEHALDADVDSQLRLACLARPIFRGIAPDLGSLNPWLKERIKHHLGLYRAFLRPLLLDGLVFHHTPWLPLRRATPWCVLEYASQDRTQAALAVFRLAAGAGERYQLRPRGLDRGRRYLVTFDNSEESAEIDGLELAGQGLSIAVGSPYGSEMVLCQALAWRSQPLAHLSAGGR